MLTEGNQREEEEEEEEKERRERRERHEDQHPSKQELIYSKRFSNSFSKEEIENIKTAMQTKVVVVKKRDVQREKQRSEPLLAMMVAPPRKSTSAPTTNYITPRSCVKRAAAGSLDRGFKRINPLTPQR